MRYLIRTTLELLAKAWWIIPLVIVGLLLGTFVFDDFGDDCEKYCEDLAITVDGRVSKRWEEAGVDFVMVHGTVAESQVLNSNMAPRLFDEVQLGDSIYKRAGTNDAALIRGGRITRYAAQELWDSCDCTSVYSE